MSKSTNMTASDYYKSIFSCKVYKISLDAGCSCPNRDGKCGTGGCIFCGEKGSGEFAESGDNIIVQVENAKKRLMGKLKPGIPVKFIAYFQNFSNTYGNLKLLSAKWEAALECPDVVGIALATRPDCISEECLEYLSKLSQKVFVQLELGFQSANEETASFFNRGYTNNVYVETVKRIRTNAPKIHLVTHIMFGLPVTKGVMETKAQMLESVKFVLKAGTQGIKITNLYIIKNTKMAELYDTGKISVLEKDEYMDLLKEAVKLIPQNIIIHRLTGDPAKKDLIAPLWCTDKKRMINDIKSNIMVLWQKND